MKQSTEYHQTHENQGHEENDRFQDAVQAPRCPWIDAAQNNHGSDNQGTGCISHPTGETDMRKGRRGDQSVQEQARHTDRSAHGGTEQSCQRCELEYVRCSVKYVAAVNKSVDEKSRDQALQGISDRNQHGSGELTLRSYVYHEFTH